MGEIKARKVLYLSFYHGFYHFCPTFFFERSTDMKYNSFSPIHFMLSFFLKKFNSFLLFMRYKIKRHPFHCPFGHSFLQMLERKQKDYRNINQFVCLQMSAVFGWLSGCLYLTGYKGYICMLSLWNIVREAVQKDWTWNVLSSNNYWTTPSILAFYPELGGKSGI